MTDAPAALLLGIVTALLVVNELATGDVRLALLAAGLAGMFGVLAWGARRGNRNEN